MLSVYKITNLINNKCYIGSSIHPEKRWRAHINAAFNTNSAAYAYPLQQAFRKYGIENFTFQIIKDDFDTIEEMQQYEQDMIYYYNSHRVGYNQTIETNSNHIAHENTQKYIQRISCQCALVDQNHNIIETYKSYHEAARLNGLDGDNCASIIRLICKGKTSSFKEQLIFRDLNEQGEVIKQPIKSYKGKKAIYGVKINNPEEEVYFSSISEAAQKLQSDRASIGKCIRGNLRYTHVKGYVLREIDINGNIIECEQTISQVIDAYNEANPIINGEQHSITEWCKKYNISKQTFYQRKKQGMTSMEAITTPKRR